MDQTDTAKLDQPDSNKADMVDARTTLQGDNNQSQLLQTDKKTIHHLTNEEPNVESATQQEVKSGRFISIYLFGSIDVGYFKAVNDVYIKYSIVSGPDWLLTSGADFGVTQISRYKNYEKSRQFVWNQPVSVTFRSYNYYGWPQIVLSVYHFDTFGNDQILGYGCVHLPVSRHPLANSKQLVTIYAPQSTSIFKQVLSWIVGKKPELIDSNLFARADCRSLLQMAVVGQVEISFDLTSKDALTNGYLS